jgi:arylsulfatase A-like enzyme/Tfp pilus assembly protein PilF
LIVRRANLFLVAAALLWACSGDDRPNVLLVTLDTTRADHLGCYGYEPPTTPNIDRIAAESWVFDHAYATNPVTLPSHTSIMTGTYPMAHGARDNSTFVVPDRVTTLAETLGHAGYETAAIVASFVLDSRFNLDQGFASYNDDVGAHWSIDEVRVREANEFGFSERKANLVTAAALDWLELPRREPFFLWLHYFDPHEPINPPEPHQSRFTEAYDAEVAFADEQLGRLLDALRRRGELDSTIVIITADHGEGLTDHDEPTHSLLIFDSTMHVPLIIRPPGGRPTMRIAPAASIVDIVPTVLDMLDIELPAEIQGRSLVPVMGGGADWPDRFVYMESLVARLQCGWSELRGLRSGTEKLIHGPKPRYYRVDQDPLEIYDLAPRQSQRVVELTSELDRALQRWRTAEAEAVTSPLDETALAQLQALGYLAGPATVPSGLDGPLAAASRLDDPHDMQRLFNLFSIALEDLRQGAHLIGIRRLETVLAADPDNPAVLTYLGKAYLIMARQPVQARAAFERALAADPRQYEANLFMARLLLAEGDVAGAERHARAALGVMPDSVEALYELARVERAVGQDQRAGATLRLALERDSKHLPSLVGLATLHAVRKEHEAARPYFDRALAIAPNNAEVLYNVAIWHLQDQDTGAAISRLEQALRAAPQHGEAHYVLGKLLDEAGDAEGARTHLAAARRLLPGPPQRIADIDHRLQQLDGP